MSTLKKISLFLFALLLAFSSGAAAFQPASAAESALTCKEWYTVERGDYLVRIANEYEVSWRSIADLNSLKNPNLIYVGQKLCLDGTKTTTGAPVAQPGISTMRVYASSVKEDDYVILKGTKLFSESRYTVYMNRYDKQLYDAYVAGYITTDKSGAFTATFDIPHQLADILKIGITLKNSSGDIAGNWFINVTATSNTGGIDAAAVKFDITSIKVDEWVKVTVSNLPANIPFDVFIGKGGTKGVDGVLVDTILEVKGGTVKATFELPAEFVGRTKLDLRIENKKLGVAVYKSLENK